MTQKMLAEADADDADEQALIRDLAGIAYLGMPLVFSALCVLTSLF
jgi:hypothetical protein